ncbi:MAG: PAS domain S-box protein [Anaerolineae bacterium]|nr:PAS domain S-box protein [Anaerolineae bacterium]
MKLPPKPSASVYLVLYLAAAVPVGYIQLTIRGSSGILTLLIVPILVAAVIYPRWLYLSMLVITAGAHGVYLLYNPSLSFGTSIGFVVSIIAIITAGEIFRWLFSRQARIRRASKENEEQLRALLNSIPDMVYTLDKNGNITTVNTPSLERLEYEVADLVGSPFLAIVHPDDRTIVSNARDEAIKGYKEYTRGLQFRIIGKDGSVHWVEMNSCIRLDDQGSFLQEYGVLRDVTRRKRVEESLTESQRALLTLMSNLPGAAYRCRNDEKWTVEFISEGCRDLTGYRPEELIGNRVIAYIELAHPDDRRIVRQEIQEALQNNQPFQLNYRMITRDGAEKWVWVKGREIALRDEIAILEGFIIDVTERRLAERAIRQSEEAYRNLFEQSVDGIIIIADDRIVGANQAFCELSGRPLEKVIGESLFSFIHPDEQETAAQRIAATMAGEPLPAESHIYHALRNDGSHIWTEVRSKAIVWDSKPAVQTIIRDVTKRKLAEEALLASEERYRMVSELTSDFAASFAAKPDGTFALEWVTDAFTRITGYTFDEFKAKSDISEIALSDDVPVATAHREKLLAGESAVNEYRIVTKSGDIRWLRDHGRPVWEAQQEHVTHIYRATQDITESKLASEALWASEQKYKSLVNAVDGIVWEWDVASERFTFVSQQAKRLLGHSPEEWMSDPHFWEDHLHPDDQEWAISYRQKSAATMLSYESEYRMLAADGRTVWVRDMVNVVSEDDAPTQLYGIMIDTTHQRLADQETGRLNVELAQRNTQLLALYETGRFLSATLELEEIYRVMYQKFATQLLDAHHFFVALFNEATQMISCDFAVVDGEEHDPRDLPDMRLANGPNSETIRSRQPLVVSLAEISNDPGIEHVRVGDERKPLSALYVPMLRGDKVIGVLNMQSYKRQAFGDVDMTLVSTLANQAAVAIENARLVESERRQLRLAQNLQAVGSLLTAEMSLNEVLELIFNLLAEVITYDSVSVQLAGRDGKLYLKAWRGFPDIEHAKQVAQKIAHVPFDKRWGQRAAVVIPDTAKDERWNRSLGFGRVRSWIGAPLWVKGRFIGVLNVDSAQPDTYNDDIAHTAEAFANQAAIAIENARLFTESEERNQRLALLNRITRTGATILDVEELAQALVDTTAGIIDSDECYITLWDARNKKTIPFAASGPVRDTYQTLHWEPGERTLTASVLETGRPLVVGKAQNSPSSVSGTSPIEVETAASVLGVPLHVEEQDLGALLIAFSEERQLTGEEILWAEQAGELIALALSKALAYADLEKRVAERTVELTNANERLLALTKLKDEFVSNVSHELRTPIASIKLYLRLLTLKPEKEATYLDRLDRETIRLEYIIEDLLQLSRMDQGRTWLKLSPTDLNRLAQQFVIDREVLAKDRGLKLTFKPKAELPTVQTDEMLLGQALSILLTNALNYTPSGGKVTISTQSRRFEKKRWAGLSVRDTGLGIPPEDLPQLFQRFFRGKVGRSSGMPGTGLGLAIAKQIVDWHHGQIEVISNNDSRTGTVFTIWIPVETPQPE